MSGAPLETIHQTCDEVNDHLREVKSIADEIGVGFIGLGAAPHWTHDEMPLMPKGRYKLMDSYMQKVGTMGTSMMRRTCTVQVNLDFGSEADMVQKMRVALALQPVATALFANSPFFEGKLNGHKSWRARIWRDLDPDRTGMLPFVFEDGFGFEAWVDYALDVPMYFVYRDGKYIDALGMSFRDFLKGELPALPGEIPTLSDWADHLTTIFPEARLKKFIEMRGADGGPWRRLCALPAFWVGLIYSRAGRWPFSPTRRCGQLPRSRPSCMCALPAFWVGLIYDQSALDAATDLIAGWSAEFRDQLRVAASVDGIHAEVDGVKMMDLALEAVAIADAGLAARARPGRWWVGA